MKNDKEGEFLRGMLGASALKAYIEAQAKLDEKGFVGQSHDTGVRSKSMGILLLSSGPESYRNVIAAMDIYTTAATAVSEMAGNRASVYALFTAFLGGLDQLMKNSDEKFAKAIMTDLHAAVVAEKWNIMKCIHVDGDE